MSCCCNNDNLDSYTVYVLAFLSQVLPLFSEAETFKEPNSVTLTMEVKRSSKTSKNLIFYMV